MAFSIITDIQALDERTVAITISEPSNEFISYLTTAILPADYEEQDTAPVGTGSVPVCLPDRAGLHCAGEVRRVLGHAGQSG